LRLALESYAHLGGAGASVRGKSSLLREQFAADDLDALVASIREQIETGVWGLLIPICS
jgi:hypothetical protein